MSTWRRSAMLAALVVVGLSVGCSSEGSSEKSSHNDGTAARSSTTGPSSTTGTASTASTGDTASSGADPCGGTGPAPTHYDHVVVFSFENRSWSTVGGPGFAGMPYLASLARQCSWFPRWSEADPTQNSATQYVAQMQGDTDNTVRNDCHPSATCRSTADNLFRQARTSGLTAVNYVEDAPHRCSAKGNASRHIPALYFMGADDQSFCAQQVLPYRKFNPDNPPHFAFVSPNLCHDGHDCDNATVDEWARQNIGAVLASPSYASGRTLVEVWYDEDRPVPNLFVAPTARAGPVDTPVDYRSTLRLWQDVLGLPCLAGACGATDLRSLTGI